MDLEACGRHIVLNEPGMPFIGEGSPFMYKDESDCFVTQGLNWSHYAAQPFWRCQCDPLHNGRYTWDKLLDGVWVRHGKLKTSAPHELEPLSREDLQPS